MKRNVCAAALVIALVVLSGASVWEGSAAVSMEFPESGLYVATNSFPRNTLVDLTNLETGKTVRAIVSSGLDTPGLLALISREAAEAVGLRSRSIGRIRMIAPSDPVVFSRFPEEYRSGDPDFDPLAAVEDVYGTDPSAIAAVPAVPVPALSADPAEDAVDGTGLGSETPLRGDPEGAWAEADVPPMADIPVAAVVPVPDESAATELVPDPALEAPLAAVPEPELAPAPVIEAPPAVVPVPAFDGAADTAPPPEYSYTLVPAEERPPLGAPSVSALPSPPGAAGVPQIFSVPAVANLERGKYYLQIGAYAHVPAVEQELGKIERSYPLTVQCISLSDKTAYRILIGPVNQGEAGALLRKYTAKGYKDAFVRRAP